MVVASVSAKCDQELGLPAPIDVKEIKRNYAAAKPEVQIEERLFAPEPEVQVKERLFAPEPEVQVKERLFAPEPEVQVKERLFAPEPEMQVKERFFAPKPEVQVKESEVVEERVLESFVPEAKKEEVEATVEGNTYATATRAQKALFQKKLRQLLRQALGTQGTYEYNSSYGYYHMHC